MKFTAHQYDEAIKALQQGRTQLEADGNTCAICGDDHMAWECNHNPLRAMALCNLVAERADMMHDALHVVIGACYPSRHGWRTYLPAEAPAEALSLT